MPNLFDHPHSDSSSPPSRRAIYIFPILVVTGILALIGFNVGEVWSKAPMVETSRVRMVAAQAHSTSQNDEDHFRAAGWLRAGPYPIQVTGLAGGIVKAVHVIEGDFVEAGQLLVELDDSDADLEHRQAEQRLKLAMLERDIAASNLNVAIHRVEEHLKLCDQLEVSLDGLRKDHKRLVDSGPGISLREIEQALYRVKEKEVEIKVLLKQRTVMETEKMTSQKRMQLSEENVRFHQLKVEESKLNLDRMKIRAPVSGIIKDLYARVGRKQLLQANNPLSATVARIYDPSDVYVEVDVPLSNAFEVSTGQKAIVEIEGFKSKLSGLVTHLAGEADEQKNTLSVRVKVLDPPNSLRPGMLSQVLFKGSQQSVANRKNTALLLHPNALLGDRVGTLDENGRLKWKQVKIEDFKENGWHVIGKGLYPGETTVLNPHSDWKDGQILLSSGDERK